MKSSRDQSDDDNKLDCTFGAVYQAGLVPDPTNHRDDIAPLAHLLVPAVQALACGSGKGKCRAGFFRDDKVALGSFSRPTIRYGWASIEQTALSLNIDLRSEVFAVFALTIFAHEYGHFLDIVRAEGRATENFCEKHQFCKEYSINKRRELWADAVSGCVLARSGAATKKDVIDRSIEAYAKYPPNDHPNNEHRYLAMARGWEECDSKDAPTMPIALRILSP